MSASSDLRLSDPPPGRILRLGPAAARMPEEVLRAEVVPRIRAGRGRAVEYVLPGGLHERRRRAEALALAGGAAFDLPFTTLEKVVAGRFRALPGARRQVSAVERRVLLERAIEDLERRPPWPGLVERIGRLAQELAEADIVDAAAFEERLRALAPGELAAGSGGPAGGPGRLLRTLRRYGELLEARGLADGGRARAAVAAAEAPPLELLVVEGFAALGPLDRRVVAALVRSARRAIVIVEDERTPPPGPASEDLVRHLEAEGFVRERREAAPTEIGAGGALAARLWTDVPLLLATAPAAPAPPRSGGPAKGASRAAAAPTAEGPPPVELLRADSPALEIEAIARRVREIASTDPEAALDLSRILVVVPRVEQAAPLVREVFPRAGIPFAVLRGEPLSRTSAARLVVDWIECVQAQFERAALSRALLAPSVTFTGRSHTPLDVGRLDRIAREAGIAGAVGRRGWREKLEAHRDDLARKVEAAVALAARSGGAEDAFAPSAESIAGRRRDIAAIDAGVPVLDEALAALEALAAPAPASRTEQTILRLLQRFGVVEHALGGAGTTAATREAAALRSLAGVLRDLTRGLGPDPVPLERYLAALRAAISGETAAAPSRDERGRVLLIAPGDARGIRARHVIVGGLDAGRFPGGRSPDLFLGEPLRRALGLESPEDRRARAQASLAAALAAGPRSVTLTFAASPEDPAALSPLVIELARRVPGGLTPRPAPPLVLGPTAEPEPLARATSVAQERATSGAPGRFEGRVDGAALARLSFRIFGPDGAARLSTTDLETYARCPFRALLGRLLGIEALPDPEEDDSAREIGDLLHRALDEFYEGFERESGAAWLAAAIPRLRRLVEERLRIKGKDAFWDARVDKLLAGLDSAAAPSGPPGPLRAFLEREAEPDSPGGARRPTLREESFSLALAVPSQAGARTIRVRGTIDRADTDEGRAAFVVYDYKSGRHPPDIRDVVEGRRFQLPLYLLGAKAKLGPGARPLGAAYLPLAEAREVEPRWLGQRSAVGGRRSAAGVVDDLDAALGGVPGAIGAVLDGMASGLFHPGDLPERRKGCDYCEFQRACRVDHDRMAAAFRGPSAGVFRPAAILPTARGAP